MTEDQHNETTLRLLTEIERDGLESQRGFSSRLGIAVGLTNAYIRRCLKKGWIKMSKAPARRYAYYLTPKGFSEKSRLTADYLSSSFQFFRDARTQCVEALAACREQGWNRVALYGAGDLMDIALLSAQGENLLPVAIIDPHSGRETFSGIPVVTSPEGAAELDAVLVTDIQAPQEAYDTLRAFFPAERILTPPLLNITREPPAALAGSDAPAH